MRQRLLVGMLTTDTTILNATSEAMQEAFPEYEVVMVSGTTGFLLLPPGEEGE